MMAQPRRCWALPRRWWALDRPPPLCGERPQSDLELSGLVVCTVSAACRPSPVAWTRRARVQGVRSRAASHPRLGEELSHKDVQQVSGISSASLTPTPQLFQACDESYSGFGGKPLALLLPCWLCRSFSWVWGQVLEEQKSRSAKKGAMALACMTDCSAEVYPTSHTYKIGSRSLNRS